SYTGIVEKFDDHSIIVNLDSPVIGESGDCSVNFVFNNNYHYFDSELQILDDTKVLIFIPELIKKKLTRKYKRLYVDGKVFMRFKVIIQSKSVQFKDSPLMDERFIFQEVKKPKPAIDKILISIKNLVSEFAQKIQIKVYKQNDKFDFIDKVLRDTKQIFLIYNSYEDSLDEKRFMDKDIMTIMDVFNYYIRKGEPRKRIEDKLLDLLQDRRNKRIFSECYIPLLLEDEVVGYIRLINDFDFHRNIKPMNALKTKQYAEVLVEALVKYDYFRLDSGKDYNIPVVDISAGGLLFRLEDETLKRYLAKNTLLEIDINLPYRRINARGIVTRVMKEHSEYAVKFQEIEQEDAEYLNSLAQGKIKI
ncbi:MAG TPA: PilZ domain-containing protein, partial [candidate division WOR-3 bacterium]|nr:PilZ domain-containing protein [candidate division WOR-3 bacterium]